ncbi:MAG: peroxidase [Gemmatimonadetes bacterium]|nr:peroxidase [Gemmatimonadota bacterium]MBT8403423.1 peroxidase [Gemmatimonadota bacterium]
MDSDELARALALDPAGAVVSAADRAMLDYAELLTRRPHAVTARDVEALRAHGFSDAAVLDICQVVSYYNYVNRMADGLGVELETEWSEQDMVVTPDEFRGRGGADS